MAKQMSSSLILSSVLISLAITLVLGNDNNVLLSGEVLGTDSQLQYEGASFIMQGDCNLVLYNGGSGFQSNTHGRGTNCSLTLNNQGQLVINNGDGQTVWRSQLSESTPSGKYAAVLRPDGQVAVYGPMIWSTPLPGMSSSSSHDVWLANMIPRVRNVLFSSQTLYNNAELTTRDYSFIMQDDCNLVLKKAIRRVVWQSQTAGNGQHCFLRLNHRGQLTILDDESNAVWYNGAVGDRVGDYVLIMQLNGQAAIYGPIVWSTDSDSKGLVRPPLLKRSA